MNIDGYTPIGILKNSRYTFEKYIEEVSKKLENYSAVKIDLKRININKFYKIEFEEFFSNFECWCESECYIEIPKRSFYPKYLLRNYVNFTIIFEKPEYDYKNKILRCWLIDTIQNRFIFLKIYNVSENSLKRFLNAIRDIHNKNISKNFNLVEKFSTINKKLKCYNY